VAQTRLADAGRAGEDRRTSVGTGQHVTQQRQLRRPPYEWRIRHRTSLVPASPNPNLR
jgi:hypothetical protein